MPRDSSIIEYAKFIIRNIDGIAAATAMNEKIGYDGDFLNPNIPAIKFNIKDAMGRIIQII